MEFTLNLCSAILDFYFVYFLRLCQDESWLSSARNTFHIINPFFFFLILFFRLMCVSQYAFFHVNSIEIKNEFSLLYSCFISVANVVMTLDRYWSWNLHCKQIILQTQQLDPTRKGEGYPTPFTCKALAVHFMRKL